VSPVPAGEPAAAEVLLGVRDAAGASVHELRDPAASAIALRDAGFDAKYMNSSHSGMKAIGSKFKKQNT
jgi:hypothetical protein